MELRERVEVREQVVQAEARGHRGLRVHPPRVVLRVHRHQVERVEVREVVEHRERVVHRLQAVLRGHRGLRGVRERVVKMELRRVKLIILTNRLHKAHFPISNYQPNQLRQVNKPKL